MTECPYCLGFKPSVSINFQSLYPAITKDWDQEKNEHSPDKFNVKSQYKAWWKCINNHCWKTTIYNRTQKKLRCPECQHGGSISLSVRCPELLRFWDYQNNAISIDAVTIGSENKFYWKCSKCNNSFQEYMNVIVSNHFEGILFFASFLLLGRSCLCRKCV